MVSYGQQRNALRRQLWRQFMASLDPDQRAAFYKTIAPYPRKRLERALIHMLTVLGKVDTILAESEPPARA